MRKKSQSYGRTAPRSTKLVRHARQLRNRALRLGRQLARWESSTRFADGLVSAVRGKVVQHGPGQSVAPIVSGQIVILYPAKKWSRRDVDCAVYALERQGCPYPTETIYRVLERKRNGGE